MVNKLLSRVSTGETSKWSLEACRVVCQSYLQVLKNFEADRVSFLVQFTLIAAFARLKHSVSTKPFRNSCRYMRWVAISHFEKQIPSYEFAYLELVSIRYTWQFYWASDSSPQAWLDFGCRFPSFLRGCICSRRLSPSLPHTWPIEFYIISSEHRHHFSVATEDYHGGRLNYVEAVPQFPVKIFQSSSSFWVFLEDELFSRPALD